MKIRSLTLGLLAIYFGMVTIGLVSIAVGWGVGHWITPVSTVIGFAFGMLHAAQRMGWRRAISLLAIIFVTGLTLESIGVATGAVYGPYHYTEKLGPKFLGLVPYLIPAAWFMMLYPALLIGRGVIAGRVKAGWLRWLAVAALGGIAMTAWDLVMDPLMVGGGHWVWAVEGAYFGIPLQNYWGWWLTSFLALLIFQLLEGRLSGIPQPLIEERWAMLLYAIIGASNVVGGFLTGYPGPALVGLFAMLPWALAGWLTADRSA